MKIIVDILMFVLMLLEFSRNYMSPLLHEIIGITLFILVIIHLVLNKNYIKNVFKGKYNYKRCLMLCINGVFFISLFLSLIFGILSSQNLFKIINLNNMVLIKLHKSLAYTSLVVLGLHIGINSNAMMSKMEKKVNKKIIYLIELIITIYGIYSFIKLDILKHISGSYGFSINTGNIFSNILKYVCVVLMFGIILNYINKLIKIGRKEK